METPSDELLITRIRAGDAAAFAQLYHRFRLPLFRFCLRLSGDSDRAADAVQEAFLRLYQAADMLREPATIKIWLFRVARNEVLMALRGDRNGGDPDTLWDNETPETLMEKSELGEMIEQALRCLKREYREVLLLREEDGLSYVEIAAVTGNTESSVKSRLFKARKAMATLLAPRLGERRSA